MTGNIARRSFSAVPCNYRQSYKKHNMLKFALLKANGFKYVLTDKHVLKGMTQSELPLMQTDQHFHED